MVRANGRYCLRHLAWPPYGPEYDWDAMWRHDRCGSVLGRERFDFSVRPDCLTDRRGNGYGAGPWMGLGYGATIDGSRDGL